MKSNHSIPAATVIPVLIYPDVREAVAWLSAAFGFTERVRIGENHRAQLRLGDGALIVGDVRGDRRPPRPAEATHSRMGRVADARAGLVRLVLEVLRRLVVQAAADEVLDDGVGVVGGRPGDADLARADAGDGPVGDAGSGVVAGGGFGGQGDAVAVGDRGQPCVGLVGDGRTGRVPGARRSPRSGAAQAATQVTSSPRRSADIARRYYPFRHNA